MVTNLLTGVAIKVLEELLSDILKQLANTSPGKVISAVGNFKNYREESSDYAQNYLRRHGIIQILGMRSPIEIDQVYTDLELLMNEQDSAFGWETAEELNKNFGEITELISISYEKHERVSALNFLANKNTRVVVLGGPGAGKSTLLKRAGIKAWENSQHASTRNKLIPVFLELKELNKKDTIDLRAEIIEEFRIRGIKTRTEEIVEFMLKKGNALVILDGLDELNEDKRYLAVDAIQRLSDEYGENSFLVSCRQAAYRKKIIKGFSSYEISVFDDRKIEDVIKRWFIEKPKLGRDCWEKLSLPKHSNIKKIAKNPLILSMICINYKRSFRFQSNRSSIYKRAIKILLEEWNEEKAAIDRYDGLDAEQVEILLEILAYEWLDFSKNKILPFMTRSWMSNRVEKILENMETIRDFQGDELLEIIELDHGLLIKQSSEAYSFTHVTIQQFFCAQYVVRKFSRVKYVIEKYLLEEKWRDVFVFLCGLRQSEDILDEIVRKTHRMATENSYNNRRGIERLLGWASDKAVKIESNSIPIQARRASNVYIAFLIMSYSASSQRLFDEVQIVLKMQENMINRLDLDNRAYEKLKSTLKYLRILIEMLKKARKNSGGYINDVNYPGGDIRIRNMKKHISDICKYCDFTIKKVIDCSILRDVNLKSLNEICQGLGKDALNIEASPQNYLGFCDQFISYWILFLGLDGSHRTKINVEEFYSHDAREFQKYIYCMDLLNDCSDMVRHLSEQKWKDIQMNTLFFYRWI